MPRRNPNAAINERGVWKRRVRKRTAKNAFLRSRKYGFPARSSSLASRARTTPPIDPNTGARKARSKKIIPTNREVIYKKLAPLFAVAQESWCLEVLLLLISGEKFIKGRESEEDKGVSYTTTTMQKREWREELEELVKSLLKGTPRRAVEEVIGGVTRFFERELDGAGRDPLVSLPMRGRFREMIAEGLAKSKRYGAPFSLLYGDLDHFKRVNDGTEGYKGLDGKVYAHHDAGDQLLKDVAGILRKNLRAGDVMSRWGGEELVIALPLTPLDQAVLVGERMRRQVERCTLHTISIGIAAYPSTTAVAELDRLITDADSALYSAKERGRNRCVIYGETQKGCLQRLA